ncbi:hypothetical protein CsSME_00004540 [Camellia sinensis var. sinensis]
MLTIWELGQNTCLFPSSGLCCDFLLLASALLYNSLQQPTTKPSATDAASEVPVHVHVLVITGSAASDPTPFHVVFLTFGFGVL